MIVLNSEVRIIFKVSVINNFFEGFNFYNNQYLGIINPLSANLTKWSNTFKKFVGNLPTNFLSVFDHFTGLGLKD